MRVARQAVTLLGCALMLRGTGFFATELHVDEGLYVVQAFAWLSGAPPYVGVFDMHPVGMPAILALAQALFGHDILVVRLLGVVATTLAALLLSLLSRSMGASPMASLIGAMLFIALGVGGTGVSVNTHVVFAPLTVAGMLLALRLIQRADQTHAPALNQIFALGVPFGIGLWIKQTVLFPACFAWLAVVAAAHLRGLAGPGRLAAYAGVYALACGLPSLVTMGLYAAAGEFHLFAYANFGALFVYRDIVEGVGFSIPHAMRQVLLLLWPAIFASLPLLLPTAPGAVRPAPRATLFLMGWIGAEMLAAIAPGHLYDHHFLVLAPPLAITAALGFDRIASRFAIPQRSGWAVAALGAWPLAILTVAAAQALTLKPLGLRHPDPNRQVAQIIRASLAQGETIWVPDASPIIYVLSGVTPPTRFVFPAQLTGDYHPILAGIVDVPAELGRIASLRPRFIVRLVQSDRLNPHADAMLAALMQDYALHGTFRHIQLWQRRG